MVKLLPIGMENAISFESRGKITDEDILTLTNKANNILEKNKKLVILEQIESFEGINIDSFEDEFKYLHTIGIDNVEKIAIITDSQWIKKIENSSISFFENLDVELFDFSNIVNAMFFLNQK
jgi:hypothetical protein